MPLPDLRPTAAAAAPDEQIFEQTLRPKTLAEFVGQEKIKENLSIFLEAARRRKEPIEHVLLYGNPGLGKTTLAHVIAAEMRVPIKVTSGPALEKVGDLAAILSSLEPGEVLFVDEIHRLNRQIEEVLYPAMEDFALDLVVGKGPAARTLRLTLPRFTLIGATTRMSLLSSPLRDRFGVTYRLDYYEEKEILSILKRSAKLLGVAAGEIALQEIASRSRRTPRVANRLLKRVRDYAEVRHSGTITSEIAVQSLASLEVDRLGLDAVDRRLLTAIIERFRGGPVGLSALAAATAEEVDTIEEIYEPFLLRLGFLERTPRGRLATPRAYEHLGLKPPERPTLL
ncbi:Holliday junction branch migration DNA helicase RuvB [Patescibacteria group bacterium]|nr:MAG: Holliday junction branch migration DNA helicase RuvB [Patescibacteria group bacterium]